jgi:hypothetical protein
MSGIESWRAVDEGSSTVRRPRSLGSRQDRGHSGVYVTRCIRTAAEQEKPLSTMADYFQLISLAVASLAKNSSENRQALYGRGRVALVEQLRQITPSLTNAQLIHEQADLENAIRRVELQHLSAPTAQSGVQPIVPMPKLFPKVTD